MVNHKTEDDQPADDHGSRRDGLSLVAGYGILLRFGEVVFVRQLNGRDDMRYERREQKDSNCPEDRSQVMQEFRVCIYPIRSQINLQVSEEVAENVQNEDDACGGDDDFFSDRRLVKGDDRRVGKPPDGSGGQIRDRHSKSKY